MTLQEQQAELAALAETIKAREAWERVKGIKVQFRLKSMRGDDSSWNDVPRDPIWTSDLDYRLSPPPKTVPLSQEDLPPQPWFTYKEVNTTWLCSRIQKGCVQIGIRDVKWEELQSEGWLYAPSHLGPWKPCSKEIDQ